MRREIGGNLVATMVTPFDESALAAQDENGWQSNALSLMENLTIVLREYDALRKEAEQSLVLMPEIGKSIGIVIAGALIGLRSDLFGKGVLLCVPPIIMLVLAAVSHTHAKLEATSRRIMRLEERVYRMTKAPLITHETRMNLARLGRGGRRWFLVAVIGTFLYVLVAIILYSQFNGAFPRENRMTWIDLYWTFVGLAATYGLFAAGRIAWQRRHIPRTTLCELEQERIRREENKAAARNQQLRKTTVNHNCKLQ